MAEQESYSSLLLRYVQAGVVIHGPDSRILLANDMACHMLGVAPGQLEGASAADPVWSFLREDQTPMPPDEYPVARVIATRRPVRDLVVGRRSDLSSDALWAQVSAFPEIAPTGELGRVVVTFIDITERRRTEEALRASTAKLEAALASMTDAVFISDAGGRFTHFNDAFATFHRFRNKEECATTLAEYPEFLDVFLANGEPAPLEQWAVSRALRGETATNAEYTLRRRDTGETWEGSYSLAPIRDTAGAIVGSVVVGRDITERKRAETALRESEARFSTIFNASPIGINIFGLADNRSREVNESYLKIVGYSREEIRGHTAEELNLFIDREARAAWTARLREGKPVLNQDARLRRKSGEIRQALASIEVIDISGDRMGLVIVADITERKQAEEALRESEDRFRALIDGAPDGIYVQGEGRFLFLNPAMVRLIGAQAPEELVGTDMMLRIAPEYHEAVRARIRSQGDGSAAPPMELEYLRLDGTRIAVETVAVAIRFQGRDSYLVFVRDGTARRIAEGERENLQAQLLQAQKMESVGRLAGGVAHDFNNILTVQRGYCEMLKHGLNEEDPMAKGLAQIDACAERAARLTRQLLAFSRKQALQPRVFDMNGLVADLEQMLRRLIGEDVDLRAVAARAPAMVKADPGQIEQVLVNLAVNARDAMPEGGKLTIQVAPVELDQSYAESHVDVVPGRYVMLAMSDTGTGMDEETMRRIFEPFFTTKGEGKGTGLGLSTVYGIVHQSGGSIWVYSEPGKGTTFKVYLPRVQEEAAAPAAEKTDTARGKGEMVLIVEDEPTLRELAQLIIENLGYRAAVTANAGEALILVEEQGMRPDVILTDVVMPGMSGRLLVDRLRRTMPDVKVIYMSGYTEDAIVHHGVLEAGIEFLQKPFTVAALAATLSSALGGR